MDWNAYYLAAAAELGLGVHQPPIPPPPPLSWLAIVLRKQKVRGSNPGATDGRGWSGIRSISLKPRIVEV